MAIEFLKPSGPLKFHLSGTTFLLKRMSSSETEAIKRTCWEEGKMGFRQGLNEDMFCDKMLEAALIGWENFVDAESKEVIPFSEEVKTSFIQFGDKNIKDPMFALLLNPTAISKLFDVVAEKKD